MWTRFFCPLWGNQLSLLQWPKEDSFLCWSAVSLCHPSAFCGCAGLFLGFLPHSTGLRVCPWPLKRCLTHGGSNLSLDTWQDVLLTFFFFKRVLPLCGSLLCSESVRIGLPSALKKHTGISMGIVLHFWLRLGTSFLCYFLKAVSLLSPGPWQLGRGKVVFCSDRGWGACTLCRAWQSDCQACRGWATGLALLHPGTQKRKYVGSRVRESKVGYRVQPPVRTRIFWLPLCYSAPQRPFPCGARDGHLPGPHCPTSCDSAQPPVPCSRNGGAGPAGSSLKSWCPGRPHSRNSWGRTEPFICHVYLQVNF